jgi:hypothetical protein
MVNLGVENSIQIKKKRPLMVPINMLVTPAEIENESAKNGVKNIVLLTRGADFDCSKHIHHHISFGAVKNGLSEDWFVFSKQ